MPITSFICVLFSINSGKASLINSHKVGTSLCKKGSSSFKTRPNLDALLKILLSTYPLPSFDGKAPSTLTGSNGVRFYTNNCNKYAAKVDDNATLDITTDEPIYIRTIKSSFLNGTDNFTLSNNDIVLNTDLSSTSGDLTSYNNFSFSRKFKETDYQINSLVGGDVINFNSIITDPAGNEIQVNSSTDGSSVIFDRIPPKLDNVSLSTDTDTQYKDFIMSGSLLEIKFEGNEELRRRVDSVGTNSISPYRANCVGECCKNPYVIRKYCTSCIDNITTMKFEENINQNKIKVVFGKNLVCKNGSINKKINLKSLNAYMKNKIIEISVFLNSGSVNHTIYGNDLTHEYIRINAEYRS